MQRRIRILISLAFLGYSLIRIGVGSALLGQEIGLLDLQPLREPVDDIAGFLARSSDKQIIPISVAGYVGYIALMGLVLLIGSIGSLKDQKYGLVFIASFIAMYALLFVNFQTINPKAIHLAVCAALFGTLLWMRRHGRI